MAITSKLIGARGRRQAEKLGIDPSRVPPGQYLTEKFPVLTVGRNPRFDLAAWELRVDGEVESPLTLSWEELKGLPQAEVTVDIHCVTRWSKLDTVWRGVRVRDLMERVAPTDRGTHLMAHCDGGYTTNLPLDTVMADEVLVAHTYAGKPLEPDHGAPAAPARTQALLLEVGEVPAPAGGDERRPHGLLGAQRLPQRRRPVAGAAPLVLDDLSPTPTSIPSAGWSRRAP